ncbi:ABC transporter permease [Hydrogenophaga sp. OTU3427]|uniref:ABC transporter permease n=1 Tax=Hydrogenophaga sp. OTU3427 TaxID=3043856 RepID=UPI00313B3B68
MSALAHLVMAIGRRVMMAIPVVMAIVVLTFVLIRLSPTDPAVLLAGDAPAPEFLERIRAQYHLDESIAKQLTIYVASALQGDLGMSIYFRKPVIELILEHAPVTFLLTISSLVMASAIGVSLAVLAASRPGTPTDTAVTALSLAGYSMPAFWIGQLLILTFSVWLGWLPSNGMGSTRETFEGFELFLDRIRHMALPVTSLVLFELAIVTRFTRAAMVQALRQDYVAVAHAKGASPARVLWRHALPNALVTTVTVLGLEFGFLLAGSVVTEIVFGWPGLGRLFFDAIFRRDFPLLTGCFIFTSVMVVLANMITDALVTVIDPRTAR